ncbi:MAG: ATP-binding protein [Candidatus Altiarchaeota archaeon]
MSKRIITPGELPPGEFERLKGRFWEDRPPQPSPLELTPDLRPEQVNAVQKAFGDRVSEWDSSPHGTVILDSKLRIVYWNLDKRSSAGETWGRPESEVLGRQYSRMVPGIMEEGRVDLVKDVLEGGARDVEILEMPHHSRRRGRTVFQNMRISSFNVRYGDKQESFARLNITDETPRVTLRNLINSIATTTDHTEILQAGVNGLCEVLGCPKAVLRSMQSDESGLRISSQPLASTIRDEGKGGWKQSELDHLRTHSTPGGMPSRFTEKLIETGSVVVVDMSGPVRYWDPERNTLMASSEKPADLISPDTPESRGVNRVAGIILRGDAGEVIGDVRVYNWGMDFGDREARLLADFARAFSIELVSSAERQKIMDAGEQANARRVMTEILTRMSMHDIKNPLTAISMWAFSGRKKLGPVLEKASSGGVLDEADVKQLESVSKGLGIISEEAMQVRNRADAARELLVSSGSANYERVDVNSTVNAAVSVYAMTAEQRGVPLQCILPETSPNALACGDDVRRILQNLVHNALDHVTPDGRVGITASESGGDVKIDVSNTGDHIPEDKQATLFEGAGASSTGGWGVGLSGVQMLVKRQGGRINVSNTRDEDGRPQVTFSFTLRKYDSPTQPHE